MERLLHKILAIFLMFLLLFTCFSTVVSGIKIWPAKFTIEIPKWYDNTDEDNNPKIQITNVESHDVKVTVKVDNPSIQALSEGYSYIPDLSWIKVVPETITIPAKIIAPTKIKNCRFKSFIPAILLIYIKTNAKQVIEKSIIKSITRSRATAQILLLKGIEESRS